MHRARLALVSAALFALTAGTEAPTLRVGPHQTLDGRGVSVFVENNPFSPIFYETGSSP